MHRFRSLFIALVVLGLSAGVVFASKSISDAANASSAGHARAGTASGLTLPASGVTTGAAATTTTDETTGTDSTTGGDDPEKDSSTGTDASSGTGKPTDNHGAVVSAAAHLSFGDLQKACSGFDGKNKGSFISAVARGLLVLTVTTDASGGTTSVTCSTPPDATQGTVAPPVQGAPESAVPPPATAPTKLHGKANAAAKQVSHRPPTSGRPQD